MIAAIRTRFRCRHPTPDLAKILCVLLALELKDRNELRERQIRNLSPPETLHAINVQGLGCYQVKSFAKVMCQFPMPIFSLPGNLTIQACKGPDRSMPVTRPLDFATQGLVELAEFVQGLFQKLRRCDLLAVAQRQIRRVFDTEISPDFLTCRSHRFGLSEIGRQNQPVGTTVIALDRDLSDSPFPVPVFVKSIPDVIHTPFALFFAPVTKRDPDTVTVNMPTCFSRIGQGSKFVSTLDMGTTPKPTKKPIIRGINAVEFFLHRLTRQRLPVRMSSFFAVFQVTAHVVKTFVGQTVAVSLAGSPVKVFVNLPHIIKHIAETYRIRLITNLIFKVSHASSSIKF